MYNGTEQFAEINKAGYDNAIKLASLSLLFAVVCGMAFAVAVPRWCPPVPNALRRGPILGPPQTRSDSPMLHLE